MKLVSGAVYLASNCNSIVLMRVSAVGQDPPGEQSAQIPIRPLEKMDTLELPGLAIFARATEAFCATGCLLRAHANGPS